MFFLYPRILVVDGFRVPYITCIQQSLPFSEEAINAYKSVRSRKHISIYRWQMKRSCLSAERVICQSSVMQRSIRDLISSSPDKVVSIYSTPKRLERVERPSSQLEGMRSVSVSHRLLYVGTDAPYKKLDTLITAIRIIRRKLPNLGLFLTLPLNHTYADEPGVACMGSLGGSALTQAYELADILVLPSLVESGPQTPIEAMSLGIPVLVADRPYAHEICRDAAVFFDPFNPEDFAEKALMILYDEGLRERLRHAGFCLIERLRAANPYQRMIDVCVEAYRRRRKHYFSGSPNEP